MLPADQCFGAGDCAAVEVHNGLIPDSELARFDRFAELLF